MITIPKPYVEWLFHYDKINFKFYWKNHWAANKQWLIGKEAGYVQELQIRGLK